MSDQESYNKLMGSYGGLCSIIKRECARLRIPMDVKPVTAVQLLANEIERLRVDAQKAFILKKDGDLEPFDNVILGRDL